MMETSDRTQPWFQVSLSVCLALVIGVLGVVGCSKKTPATATPASTAAQDVNPAAAPVYTRPATPTVVTAPAGEPDLNQMTHTLRSWVSRTHIVPKNFEDFVAQANIQFPPPPAGKKYVIGKRMIVELRNQ